jgi:IS605 OrfB family transposase
VGGREHRTTRQVDFEAARDVVEKARGLRRLGYTVAVAVGDVRGHRKERKKGEPRCRSNRKLHSMSSHRLKRCIEDKAMEAGFPVFFVNEAYTSRACSYCGSLSTLRHKRRLKCFDCGVDVHADINGARNILARCLGIPPGSLLVHRGTRGSARTPAWGFAPDPVVQDGPAHSLAPTACDGGTFKHPRWDAPIFR